MTPSTVLSRTTFLVLTNLQLDNSFSSMSPLKATIESPIEPNIFFPLQRMHSYLHL